MSLGLKAFEYVSLAGSMYYHFLSTTRYKLDVCSQTQHYICCYRRSWSRHTSAASLLHDCSVAARVA